MKVKLFRNLRLVNAEFAADQSKMAMAVADGKITWMGPQNKIPKALKPKEEFDLKNQLVFPSFIECHTHSVFAGSRAVEFEMRNQGLSYLEIAERGGGILSTVKATRAASAKVLQSLAQARVNNFMAQGVSTLEIKSGYGLDLKSEVKILQVIKNLRGPRIISTFLGAHAKPPEFETHELYTDYLVKIVLPTIKKKKLSDRVDIFVENKFFEKKESLVYLQSAKELGFDVTIHANQLSFSEGADLALQLGAQSADHVIHLTDEQIKNFANSKTVAVLLPAADLYMKCAYPPARKLIDAGATVALATDFNPGTCPTQDLPLVGLLARLEMKMSLAEVFKAYTSGAAQALGVEHQEGRLQVDQLANFISTDAELDDFFYSAGVTPKHQLFIRGSGIKFPPNELK
jgi:imidazolonepropionase